MEGEALISPQRPLKLWGQCSPVSLLMVIRYLRKRLHINRPGRPLFSLLSAHNCHWGHAEPSMLTSRTHAGE